MASYYDYNDSDYYDDDNGNEFIDCDYCDAQVLSRNYDRHLENVHKCPYCKNYMPKSSISTHIQRKHTIKCEFCPAEVRIDEMKQHEETHYRKCKYCHLTICGDINLHIRQSHTLEATIGMVQLQRISSDRFNQLVNEKRIYCVAGQIFIKEN